MPFEVISRKEAAEKMRSEGKTGIFSVYFARRRDKTEGSKRAGTFKVIARAGDLRQMRCRYGVKKGLAGGERGYGDEEKNLVTVYDLEAASSARDRRLKANPVGDRRITEEDAHAAYRTVPIEGVKALNIKGQTYLVHDNENMEVPLTKEEQDQLDRLLLAESKVEEQLEFAFDSE